MTLRIHLLGDFYMEYSGEPYTAVDSVRLQSLLAYLLLHCQMPQPRPHLAFQLWPNSTDRQARNNLRKALHQLRQCLLHADQFLQVDTRTMQWRPDAPYTLDVVDFETKLCQGAALSDDPQGQQTLWEEAVVLYGGDLLPACYDAWILPERERLRQMFIENLEELVWLAEDRRQYAAAIRHANHLLRYDPLHEATYRRLMRLHAVCGDRASALQVYQMCVTVLRRELDVEPGPEIRGAYARLLETEVPATLRTQSASPSHAAEHLVGREGAWHMLQTAWRRAAQGHIHFCLICGEAGIGKTRLAEELLTWVAHQGIATSRTRAYASMRELIYRPIIEWLRSDALRPALETLAPVWLTEVAHLLPELLIEHPQVLPPDPWTPAGPGTWQRQRLYEALTWVVLADLQPKLLIIDDLQWCDDETLAWLHYLLHAAHGAGLPHQLTPRLLIVGMVRSEEIDCDHPLNTLQRALDRTEDITQISLTPLDVKQTADLAERLVQTKLTGNFATALHYLTGGNPLRVLQILHTDTWREIIQEAAVGHPSYSFHPNLDGIERI